MISLERLLDGLQVSVEPSVVDDDDVCRRSTADLGTSHSATVRYGIDGVGILTLAGGATVRCSARRIVVLPPRTPAREMTVGGRTGVTVAHARIRVSYYGSVGLFDSLRQPLEQSMTASDPLSLAFDEFMKEMLAHRPGARAMAEALLRRWLILLLRRCWQDAQCPPCWLAMLEDERVSRALSFMAKHPEYTLTVSGLADIAGMSRSVFAARFNAIVGQSPMEFLKSLRLERAADLLTGTELPVKTVASRAGYSSRSSFTRAFLAMRGLSPLEFRRSGRPDTDLGRPEMPDRRSWHLIHGGASADGPDRRRRLSA